MSVMTPPPSSPTSTGMKRRHSPCLSLDLSDLPPLVTPAEPTNTLIITNLNDPAIFTATNLQSIRDALSTSSPLYSFSPLRSFRRVIAVFHSIEDATQLRTLLDGETVLGQRVRVYFGAHTETGVKGDRHLAAPRAQKQFFISPPPSPPVGWEMRDEGPPNKEVHADDLVQALDRLGAATTTNARTSEREDGRAESQNHHQQQQQQRGSWEPPTPSSAGPGGRSRSSTLLFDPVESGAEKGLPCIAVEDLSGEDEDSTMDEEPRILAHTARPPVELMS